MIYVFCILLTAFTFALPFARGSREINLDTLKEPLALCVTDVEKKDTAWVRKQYYLDSAAYEQTLIYDAASAMEINEIAVFKQANEAKREALQELCQERTDQQLKSFQGYTLR